MKLKAFINRDEGGNVTKTRMKSKGEYGIEGGVQGEKEGVRCRIWEDPKTGEVSIRIEATRGHDSNDYYRYAFQSRTIGIVKFSEEEGTVIFTPSDPPAHDPLKDD